MKRKQMKKDSRKTEPMNVRVSISLSDKKEFKTKRISRTTSNNPTAIIGIHVPHNINSLYIK